MLHGLGTVEGGGRAPEPVFPPGPGPGATSRRGHGDRGIEGDCALHGVQVDHCGRPATHAIAAGVPPPPTGGPRLGPPPRPQWTIQVYTPPRAWPFSTSAVLAVMWHLAPEDAPTDTAEEIAPDLHAWPTDQDFSWRRPWGGLPLARAVEGFSLAATLQRHPDKRARRFLQTGTVPAAPPDSGWRWDARGAQALQDPWVLPLWYLPMGTLAHAAQAVKGAFPQPLLLA